MRTWGIVASKYGQFKILLSIEKIYFHLPHCPHCEGGGVARNKGIIQALEEKLGAKLYICDEAQLCGALGAALFAYEKCNAAR